MATMPRNKSVSAWASFIGEENLSFDDAVERTSSSVMKSWLRNNEDRIMDKLEKETATATFVTPAEFVEEVENDEGSPAAGIKI
jgi:hypothetical protein